MEKQFRRNCRTPFFGGGESHKKKEKAKAINFGFFYSAPVGQNFMVGPEGLEPPTKAL